MGEPLRTSTYLPLPVKLHPQQRYENSSPKAFDTHLDSAVTSSVFMSIALMLPATGTIGEPRVYVILIHAYTCTSGRGWRLIARYESVLLDVFASMLVE